MNKIVSTGNKGKGIRSDCFVTLEINDSFAQEPQIEIISKVMVMYGHSLKELCKEILDFYTIKGAKLILEDTGALSFVIAARLEAAIKMITDTKETFLFPFLESNNYSTTKDRRRFSRLYLPGNSPSLMINAGIHSPDGIILDLEDAVAPSKKHEARFLVRNALRSVDFYGAERMVRINQMPMGIEDLEFIIPNNVNLLLLPKCESAAQVELLEENIEKVKSKYNITQPIWLMPIIESALGVINAYEIAKASPHITSLAIGLEDYTADLGARRTQEGTESFYARCAVVNAAKAAGIQAIDSVFSDVSDMDALRENVLRSKALGFDGMGCIHPRQIRVIHENYAPDDVEIEKAMKIVNAFIDATEKGLGVVALGSKMIDPPVVKRAERTIEVAINTGKLTKNWRESYEKQ